MDFKENSGTSLVHSVTRPTVGYHRSRSTGKTREVLPEEEQCIISLEKLNDHLNFNRNPEYKEEFYRLLDIYEQILLESNQDMIRGVFNTFRKIIKIMLKKFDCDWLVNDPKALFSLGNIWIKSEKHAKGLNIQCKALRYWVQTNQEFPHNLENFISLMGRYQRQEECHGHLCHLELNSKLFKPYLAYSYFQIGDQARAKQLMEDYVKHQIGNVQFLLTS